jgi:glycosyltransferase involved in cell wall biosynthesis
MGGMKIAMVGSRGIPVTYSGVETSIQEIAPRLVDKGHEITVYARNYYPDIPDSFKGVAVKKLPSLNTKHFDTLTHAFLSTIHTLKEPYDIVHFHTIGPSIFSFLPRIFGMKTVTTVQGLDWQRAKWGKIASLCLRLGEFSSSNLCNHTITVSKTLKGYYDRKYKRGATYIPNGTQMPPEPRRPHLITKFGLSDQNYILFLARLVPEKGCHYLINAFTELDTDLKLVIAGGTGHTDQYVQTLKIMSGNKNIIFTGYVSGDMKEELFSNAYIYVLPSEIEGLPISLLEAMSYKKCVLASNITENLEVVNGVSPTFVNKDYHDFKNKLQQLIMDKDRVRQYGLTGFELVKRTYTWDKITDKIERIYFDLMRNATRGGIPTNG